MVSRSDCMSVIRSVTHSKNVSQFTSKIGLRTLLLQLLTHGMLTTYIPSESVVREGFNDRRQSIVLVYTYNTIVHYKK